MTDNLLFFDFISNSRYLEKNPHRKGWITADKTRDLAKPMLKNQYGQYLLKVIDEVERTGKENLD